MAKKVKMSMNTVLWYAVIVFGTINLVVAVAVLTRNLLKRKENFYRIDPIRGTGLLTIPTCKFLDCKTSAFAFLAENKCPSDLYKKKKIFKKKQEMGYKYYDNLWKKHDCGLNPNYPKNVCNGVRIMCIPKKNNALDNSNKHSIKIIP